MGGVDFVGAGWAFPLATDATGGIALVVREREIEEAIRLILATAPGERPMRPEFGCRVHDHVFAPINAATAGAISNDVRSALEQWEPRIDVLEVLVSFDHADVGTLYIDIHYSIRGYNDTRNLVFPFYTIPEEPDSAAITAGPAIPHELAVAERSG
jgi:phage baseplate assembly protein W